MHQKKELIRTFITDFYLKFFNEKSISKLKNL